MSGISILAKAGIKLHSVLTNHVKFCRKSIKFAKDVLELGCKFWMFLFQLAVAIFVMRMSVTKSFDL